MDAGRGHFVSLSVGADGSACGGRALLRIIGFIFIFPIFPFFKFLAFAFSIQFPSAVITVTGMVAKVETFNPRAKLMTGTTKARIYNMVITNPVYLLFRFIIPGGKIARRSCVIAGFFCFPMAILAAR